MSNEWLEAFTTLGVFALITEFTVHVLKELLAGLLPQKAQGAIRPVALSALVGVVLAFAFGLDLFAMLGHQAAWPAVSRVVTGLAISAGAVPLHELLAKLRSTRSDL